MAENLRREFTNLPRVTGALRGEGVLDLIENTKKEAAQERTGKAPANTHSTF